MVNVRLSWESVLPLPTAHTSLAEMAVTALNSKLPAIGGIETTFHWSPSHLRISGCLLGNSPSPANPTAQASFVETADTSCRALSTLGFGLGIIVHWIPFQCSMSVLRGAKSLCE